MISIDEFEIMLQEIADALPEDLFDNLNGGILLQPEAKLHAEAINGDLFIMGEYHFDRFMGRYISIYYGSFARVYSYLDPISLREQVAHTLKHEFRHHLESQGGERDLEVLDAIAIQKYKNQTVSRIPEGGITPE